MENNSFSNLYNDADKQILKQAEDSLDPKLDRVNEIIKYARESNIEKIGIANCRTFIHEANHLETILTDAGFNVDFVSSRFKKEKEVSKYSQPSDWMFVTWLLLMGFTSFSVRLFIDFGILEENIWLYLVHLIILVQWALIIVPFGKWPHFLYRSFAMYFAKIKT